jgi:hypothetical protein
MRAKESMGQRYVMFEVIGHVEVGVWAVGIEDADLDQGILLGIYWERRCFLMLSGV